MKKQHCKPLKTHTKPKTTKQGELLNSTVLPINHPPHKPTSFPKNATVTTTRDMHLSNQNVRNQIYLVQFLIIEDSLWNY